MVFWGYFFTLINYVCFCTSRFMKTKQQMLLLDLLAKVFTILGLYCMGSMTGVWAFALMFVLLLVANVKEKYNKKWALLFLLFQGLYFVVLWYTYAGISSILVFLNSSVYLYCVWWLSPQNIRLVGGLNCFLYLAYQLSIKNWAGLTEIFVIISNFAAFFKNKEKSGEVAPTAPDKESVSAG